MTPFFISLLSPGTPHSCITSSPQSLWMVPLPLTRTSSVPELDPLLSYLTHSLCDLLYALSMWSPLNTIYTQVTLKISTSTSPMPLLSSRLVCPTSYSTTIWTSKKASQTSHGQIELFRPLILLTLFPHLRRQHHPLQLLKPKLRYHLRLSSSSFTTFNLSVNSVSFVS